MNIIQAPGGDKIHQMVALSYLKAGISPADAIVTLKESNYVVSIKGQQYKLKASAVASIITGFNLLVHQVISGRATCTKAKGLVFKSAPKPAVEEDTSEAPF